MVASLLNLRIVACTIPPILSLLFIFWFLTFRTAPEWHATTGADRHLEIACSQWEGAQDVFVILSARASSLSKQLPWHLAAFSSCVPNLMVVSTLEGRIAGYRIFNALQDYDDGHRLRNNEFQLLEKINKTRAVGQGYGDFRDDGLESLLDRWVILPSLHRAYSLRPGSKWFLYIEAGTAVNWANLLQLVNSSNPNRSIYTGSLNSTSERPVVLSKSGILVSRAAAAKLDALRVRSGGVYAKKWENDGTRLLTGEELLAQAFEDAQVKPTEPPTIFSDRNVASWSWTQDTWCTPIITQGSMAPKELDADWRFQAKQAQEKGYRSPILGRDYFDHFIGPYLTPNVSLWDNLSGDWKFRRPEEHDLIANAAWAMIPQPEHDAVYSFEHCKEACEMKETCVQYAYSMGECRFNEHIIFGKTVLNKDRVRSGWVMERVNDLSRTLGGSCRARWSGFQ